MSDRARLSPQMLRALEHIAAGRSPATGFTTQSQQGGLNGTLYALRRRGLITLSGDVTDAGRAAVAATP